MSVIKSKRSVSTMQFLQTARELEKETRRLCVNGPKRYTFFGLQDLWQTSREVYGCVKKGNSVYPTNQHEVQMRRDYFITAGCELQDYISQLELLIDDGIIPPAAAERVSTLVSTEIGLIKALLKSDKERYRNL